MNNPITGVHLIDENMHELINHGRPEFPVAFYGDGYKYLGSRSYYAHWHNEIEVTIAIKGDIAISCNDATILVREGDAIVINSNILHCILHDNYPKSIVQTIVFNPVIIYGYHTSDIERLYVLPIINSDRDYYYLKDTKKEGNWGKKCIDAFLNAIRFNISKKDGYELGIKIMLMDAWYILYRNVPKSNVVGNTFSAKVLLVKNAINYIHKNYMNAITLDDISRNSLLSKSELCKLFKKYVNQSPIQYLLRHRISNACYYLSYSDKPVTDIANKVGISDPNYFAISFKKIMKMSPTQYRRRIAAIADENKVEDFQDADIHPGSVPLF
ncbi:MAG: AraC family transcriptional regulator [Bacilli bacterium]|nr:AraC family transcriptional regulator [Bacilli bacterium]